MSETPVTRKRFDVTTRRFRLRGLRAADATPAVCAWYADKEVTGPLNRAAGTVTPEALGKEFAAADGVRQFSIGIFPLEGDGAMIGYYTLHRDPFHRTATFNVTIGNRDWWGREVVLESRAAVLDEMFANRGIAKAIGMPHARNFPSVFNYKRQGWRQEGILRAHSARFDSNGRLDQIQFGMLSDEWAAIREKESAT